MRYQEGDQIGPFTLLEFQGRKWIAECKCGERWKTRLSRLKGRDTCPQCAPPRSFKHRQPGEVINGNTLMRRLPNRKWEARCSCGTIRIASPCDLERYNSCASCHDRSKDKRFKLSDVEKNLNYRLQYYKRHAKARALSWDLSMEQAQTLISNQCHYCGTSQANGIDRVDNSIGYTVSNCVSCCSFCNHAKKDHTKKEFLEAITRIYNFQFRDYPEREYGQAAGNMEPPSG